MRHRRFALPAGLVLAGTLALFRRPLFLGESFFERDLDAYYRPAKSLLVRLVHQAGGMPLWNPYFSFGQPFAGNPEHELFHPATWLLLLLPFEWAFRLPIVLAPGLAAAAMFFFLRTVGRGRDAALLGAVSWGFGGYLLSTVNLLPILYAVVPLPAALGFLLRAWRAGRWRDVAGLALCGGLVGLAGEPSTLLCAAALGAVTLAAHAPRRAPGAGASAAGVLLACGIAAPALVPGAIHARLTVRADGLPADLAGLWSFPPARVVELALPHVGGHVEVDDPAWYWARTLYPNRGAPFLFGIYPGLLASALALSALARRDRCTTAWVAAAVGSVVVAAGPPLLVWNAVHALPLLKGLRYPEKFVLVACFALVVLAAAGWDLLARSRRRVSTGLVLFGTAATLAAMAFAFVPPPASLVPAQHQPLLAGVLRYDLLATGIVALLSAATLAAPRRGRAALAGAVLVADLAVAGRGFVRSRPIADLDRPHPVLAPLVEHPPDGPLVDVLLESDVARRLRAVRFLSEPRPAQWGIATALGADFDLTNLRWTSRAAELFWKAVIAQPSLLAPLLARRGVAAVAVPRADATGRIRLALVRPAGRRPFAFFAERVETIASDDAWIHAVRKLGPAVAVAVCLAPDDARSVGAFPAAGRVVRLARSPGEVSVDVGSIEGAPALLAVNQTWAPGWFAEVDGRAARLLRADVDLSAVVVPPGARHVTLRYRDSSVSAALAIALLALVTTAVLAIAGRRSAP